MTKNIRTVVSLWLAVALFGCLEFAPNRNVIARVLKAIDEPTVRGAAEMAASYVPGRLLVKYRAGASPNTRQLMRFRGAVETRRLAGLDVLVMDVPVDVDVEDLARQVRSQPDVEFAEPDYIVYPVGEMIPDDPMYPLQWHLPAMSCPTAWDVTSGSDQIIIALCDTGVDGTHPDLASKLVPGWNVFDNNSDTSPVSPHGTWTAGTAAASGNNATGVASPALNCRIMPVRVTSRSDGAANISALAAGVVWAADHGARVASVSYMGAGSGLMTEAARYIQNTGGVLVMSAGNTGAYYSMPDVPEIIVASATDSNDHVAGFSTTGSYVDLSAPGVGILTTSPGNTYQAVSGTSFSTPLIAGAIALMMSLDPNLTPTQIDTILKVSADDLGPAGWDPGFGWGRLNVGRAINAVQALLTGSADTLAPAVGFLQPQIGGESNGLVGISGGELLIVNALDDRSVTEVSLSADGTLISTDTSAPYAFSWDTSTLADGSQHILLAVAKDQAGNTTSINTTITLNAGFDATPPSASFAQPQADGQVDISPGELIQVDASDNLGVTAVSLFADGLYIGTDTAGPYTFTWNTSLLVAGSHHTLNAVVEDHAGNSAMAAITVTASQPSDVTPPSVSFLQPNDGATITASPAEPITVEASDNVGVGSVSLYADGSLVGATSAAPYIFTWNTSSLASGSQHSLKAVATDGAGNAAEATVSVTVVHDTLAPLVGFEQPQPGGTVGESTDEPITINASDNVAVASVSLYADGTFIGSVVSAPYVFQWNTSALEVGSMHTLNAVAADQAGNSSSVSITVTVRDSIPPLVSFNDPQDGDSISGILNVSIDATDNVAVTQVEFYVDDLLVTSWTGGPYSIRWTTKKLNAGSHVFKCVAYDAAGNSALAMITVSTQ